jgi:mannose/cellobiose epimerase-like protein (N-acyl-D-glucosamine 2-epimerase family)
MDVNKTLSDTTLGTGFAFADTVAGYVTAVDADRNGFRVATSDGREFPVRFSAACYAELTRNLGESYVDCTGQMRDMVQPGRFLYAYGVFYPDQQQSLEAGHIIFVGRGPTEFVFEKPDWWVRQIQELGNFYFRAQFGDGPVDYRNYRTMLDLYGRQIEATRQETDTISRLIYGFASAYLLTGDERFLTAAEKGSDYLRDHFCAVDAAEGTCYWYHAVDFSEAKGKKILGSKMAEIPGMRRGGNSSARERKMLSSEFGDDWDAIPAYEQIYALAGPTQTYRITGDPKIRKDIDRTLNMFNKYYRDYEGGGYFSHIDPVTFDPKAESLGRNRARKNWNSVGDHAPAYLINLVLATNEPQHIEMLVDTATTIATRFPDYDNSAFVQEKFHEDWGADREWGWQQNRAVVGHNLKIAWNLMRMNNVQQDDRYVSLAEKIATLMPKHGGDPQRGGWYDVVERELKPGQNVHRFAFHDRKAWWQQEQGILAYLILHGSLKKPEYLKHARESAAFYSAFFLDHDSGAVYFNVLANGLPYLLGTERNKGSHSMSGYHSFELCYLAAIYTNLLITKQPLDLHFKPKPGAWQDNILRVAPDLLPKGSIKIESVTIDGKDHYEYNADELTVVLPEATEPVKVVVRLVPTEGLEHFSAHCSVDKGVATLTLAGDADHLALPFLQAKLQEIIAAQPNTLVLRVKDLTGISPAAVRALIFGKQKLRTDEDVKVIGASQAIKDALNDSEFGESVTFEK